MKFNHLKPVRSVPRLFVLASLAWQEMIHRRGTSIINALVAALTTTLLILSGYYSWAVFQGLKHHAAQSPFRRVVAFGTGARFDQSTLAELGRLPSVQLALPGIELNVDASIGGGKPRSIPIEGIQPGDGSIDPSRLSWGRTVHADAREIVLSRPLYQYLGGRIASSNAPIDSLDVVVTRSVKGAVQTHRETMPIAGLLEVQARDQIFAPLTVVDGLNLWAANKIDSPNGEPAARRQVYPEAIAYVPAEDEARVPDAARLLKIKAVKLDELTADDAGETWVRITRADRTSITADQLKQLQVGRDVFPIAQMRSNESNVVALSLEDPRWEGAPPERNALRLASKGTLFPRLRNHISPDGRSLSNLVSADAGCTLDTLIEAIHDWREDPRSGERVWARSTELWPAVQLAAVAGTSTRIESFPSWLVFWPGRANVRADEEAWRDAVAKTRSGRTAVQFAACSIGTATLRRGAVDIGMTKVPHHSKCDVEADYFLVTQRFV